MSELGWILTLQCCVNALLVFELWRITERVRSLEKSRADMHRVVLKESSAATRGTIFISGPTDVKFKP